jgi:hypothetical protein
MRVFLIRTIMTLVGLMSAHTVSAGVANTPHNLGSSGTGPNTFGGTTEVCVFCHTPHGGDATATVPLWNRTLASPASYTTYDTLGTTALKVQSPRSDLSRSPVCPAMTVLPLWIH